ncbi:MAG: hypothetical protein AAGH79_04200 [Bacteroidota bacterium]
MKSYVAFFKIAAILWIIWGAVHVFAGVMTIYQVNNNNIAGGFSGIADDVNPELLAMEYHPAAGAVLSQHGFNLLWIGIITFIGAFFVWNGNANAIFLAALTGGLADLGYFLFMDLGGYVKFVPGTVMTIVSATAILLSFLAHFNRK